MKFPYSFSILFFLSQFILINFALARPEFAVRYGVVNCSACHNSPYGGASKNVNGKLFFTRHKPMGEVVPPEYYSFDFRMNGLFPKNSPQTNNGLAIMSTIGAVHIPVQTGDISIHTKFVGDYDFGALGSTLRNAYVLTELAPREPNKFLKHILVGKFNVPFGLMSDEHWTYIRRLTKTTLNDFDTGIGFSGDPITRIHYDFALTSSNTTSAIAYGGKFIPGTTAAPEAKQGYWLNIRSDLEPLPMYVGLSGTYHSMMSTTQHPWAASLYTAFSFHRLSSRIAPMVLLVEACLAQNWNNSTFGNVNDFTPAGTYLNSVQDKKALGVTTEFQYELSPQLLMMTYRYEHLSLDQNFGDDAFRKHNVGLKWYITSNMNLLIRAESGQASFTVVPKDSVRATKDFYYAIFHYWL